MGSTSGFFKSFHILIQSYDWLPAKMWHWYNWVVGKQRWSWFLFVHPRPSSCYLHQSHICDPLSRSTSFKAALFNKVMTGHRWPQSTWNVAGPNKCEIAHKISKARRRVWSSAQEYCLEKEMATHSSILAWEISRTEEPGGLQSMGSQGVRHDSAHTHTHTTQKGEITVIFILIIYWSNILDMLS